MNRALWKVLLSRRMLICVLAGFSSGLPLFFLLQLVPAWLKTAGVSYVACGLFALVQMPYTWKFLWAPVMERWEWPFLGKRRGWMLVAQLGLMASLCAFALLDPTHLANSIAAAGIADASLGQKLVLLIGQPVFWLCMSVAMFSATQDIAIDAYRRELLPDEELALGSSVYVNAYRLAALVPGSLSLALAHQLAWSVVFPITAAFLAVGVVLSFWAPEPERVAPPVKNFREAAIGPFVEFFRRDGAGHALAILAFMFLFKIGGHMLTEVSNRFYQDLGYSASDIAYAASNASFWPWAFSGLLGGLIMVKIGINKGLWIFGFIEWLGILGFLLLALLPAGDRNLNWLVAAIAFGFMGVGLSVVAFTAFIARTSSRAHVATQLAMLTALAALPRQAVKGTADILATQLGWPLFFVVCALASVPGLLLLLKVAPWRDGRRSTHVDQVESPAAPTVLVAG